MRDTLYLQPQVINGRITYGPSLGDAPSQVYKDDVSVTLRDRTNVTVKDGIVTVTLPDGQQVQQPVGSNISGLGDAKTVGSAMVAVGGVVAVIVPVGTVIGAVIAAAGALISLFANGKAAQKMAAERAQYEQVNAQLRDQNAQLDLKISSLNDNLVKLRKDLGLSGLGFCLINCAKKKEKKLLNSAKDQYAQLSKDQEDKINTLKKMTDEVESLLIKKKNRTIVYIVLGAAVLTLAGIVIKKRMS